jgi:ligand-binding sensor domain-containing protein
MANASLDLSDASSSGITDAEVAVDYQEAVRLERLRKCVTAMCTDTQGRLWVGTEGGGVHLFDPKKPRWREWTQYTVKDGLGDNFCYAIACDAQGRIWVGHLNHGVSVYNGEKWQNYDVIAGADRPDSLSGPIGERVFAIATCPIDGDIWIATNAGFARYGNTSDHWSYYTRANGLPTDDINAITFDSNGDLYVGTACEGLLISRASNGYSEWTIVNGSDDELLRSGGKGLPSKLINDVLISRDGVVYVATPSGLAWSNDHGVSWQFVRGENWAAENDGLAQMRNSVTEDGGSNAILAEDYVTCLSEAANGEILVGHGHC